MMSSKRRLLKENKFDEHPFGLRLVILHSLIGNFYNFIFTFKIKITLPSSRY